MFAGAFSHKAVAHHAGIAEGIISGHITLISHQQINAVPGQVLATQQVVCGFWC